MRAATIFACIALVMVGAAPRVARAQGGPAPDPVVARADALFAEALALRETNPQLACEKFLESLKLNPQAIGTLLNVARCDEEAGRIASAVRRFAEARERAIELNFPDHRRAAEEKLASLSPGVPRLTIRLAAPAAPDTQVIIDGVVVPSGDLDELPVDPGDRTILVTAPGRIAFRHRLALAPRERRTLDIPPLERASSRRTVAVITVASGAATTLAGVLVGYIAHRRYEDQLSSPGCMPQPDDPRPLCGASEHAAIRSARQLGNVGTIIGGVGLAAIGVGTYLWLSAPPRARRERAVSVAPAVSPSSAGLLFSGRF